MLSLTKKWLPCLLPFCGCAHSSESEAVGAPYQSGCPAARGTDEGSTQTWGSLSGLEL